MYSEFKNTKPQRTYPLLLAISNIEMSQGLGLYKGVAKN